MFSVKSGHGSPLLQIAETQCTQVGTDYVSILIFEASVILISVGFKLKQKLLVTCNSVIFLKLCIKISFTIAYLTQSVKNTSGCTGAIASLLYFEAGGL